MKLTKKIFVATLLAIVLINALLLLSGLFGKSTPAKVVAIGNDIPESSAKSPAVSTVQHSPPQRSSLNDAGLLVVTVVDPFGKPIEGAGVSQIPNMRPLVEQKAQKSTVLATSNVQGELCLSVNDAPNDHRFLVCKCGYIPVCLPCVREGKLTVTLARARSITLKVVSSSGIPVQNVPLQCSSRAFSNVMGKRSPDPHGRPILSGVTNQGGFVTFDQLNPGKVFVNINSTEYYIQDINPRNLSTRVSEAVITVAVATGVAFKVTGDEVIASHFPRCPIRKSGYSQAWLHRLQDSLMDKHPGAFILVGDAPRNMALEDGLLPTLVKVELLLNGRGKVDVSVPMRRIRHPLKFDIVDVSNFPVAKNLASVQFMIVNDNGSPVSPTFLKNWFFLVPQKAIFRKRFPLYLKNWGDYLSLPAGEYSLSAFHSPTKDSLPRNCNYTFKSGSRRSIEVRLKNNWVPLVFRIKRNSHELLNSSTYHIDTSQGSFAGVIMFGLPSHVFFLPEGPASAIFKNSGSEPLSVSFTAKASQSGMQVINE